MMDVKVDFKNDGFVFNVNGKEEFHEYSPFFPYDIIQIITPQVVASEKYAWSAWGTWGNITMNHKYLIATADPTTSHEVSTQPNVDLYTSLIKKLTPSFIKKSFKYWNYEPFADKIIELFNRHKSIFSANFVDGKPRFYHDLCNICDMFPDAAESGLSSPFTFLLSLIHKDKEKEYFLDDLIKFSETKVVYICEEIFKKIFNTSITVYPIFDYIEKHGIDKIKDKETENLFDIYTNIVKNIPKSVDRFPLHESCHIPTLTVYPETEFQWALVNGYIKSLNTTIKFEESFANEITRLLLPYIQASEKALKIYKDFRAREANNINWAICEGREYNDKYELDGMLQYIKDGKEIYERYQGRTIEKEGRLLKMTEVKGSFLKQLKNSMYNHNLEEKMSIDEKLQLLLDEKTEPDMYIDMKLSEVLEDHRIKTKKEMIILGKELGHCLGTKVDSKDLFFRFETVCVQISVENYRVVQCSDRKNKTTETSELFELFLCDEFNKIGIELTSKVYYDEELRNDVRAMHGVDINEDGVVIANVIEENINNVGDNAPIIFNNNVIADENNNFQIYNDTSVTCSSTIPTVGLKVEEVNIGVFDDSKEIDDIKQYRTYQSYQLGDSTSSETFDNNQFDNNYIQG